MLLPVHTQILCLYRVRLEKMDKMENQEIEEPL